MLFRSNSNRMEHRPVIYNEYICWQLNSGDDGLFLFNRLNEETKQIAPQGSQQDIYKNNIVFLNFIKIL